MLETNRIRRKRTDPLSIKKGFPHAGIECRLASCTPPTRIVSTQMHLYIHKSVTLKKEEIKKKLGLVLGK